MKNIFVHFVVQIQIIKKLLNDLATYVDIFMNIFIHFLKHHFNYLYLKKSFYNFDNFYLKKVSLTIFIKNSDFGKIIIPKFTYLLTIFESFLLLVSDQ